MRQLHFLYIFLCLLLLQPAVSQAQKVKKRAPKTTSSPAQALPKSLLWEISGNGLQQPSYLYGTFHLLNDSYLSSVPAVQESFAKSKGVVVETEIDSSALMQLAPMMIMPDNKISKLLSPEDYQLVAQEVKQRLGYDMTMLDQMKPMTLMLMLAMLEYQKLEVLQTHQGKPLDVYFAEQGKAEGKKITSLETMEQQFDMLYNHYPVEKQAAQLVQYVQQKEKALQMQTQLTDLYFAQDLTGMWDASEAYNKLMGEEDMAYILDDRNKNWMAQLPQLMKQQPTFIAVGAMHLPGENGLIQLLQKAGYKVKPLQ